MVLEQHYYTSWADPNGTSGFHTRGTTPHLTADMVRDIEEHVSYSITPQMMNQTIDQHPIALRYVLKNHQLGYLIHIVSSGKDEQGREGNLFAHTLVGTLEELATAHAPIMLWGSDLWVRQDPQPGEPLNIKPIEDLPIIDFEQFTPVYNLVAQHPDLFAKLLTAVMTYPLTSKRVVIADTNERLMQWIAAISMALPSYYARQISFSTYSKGHRGLNYHIIGVPEDTSFSQSDYHSYFVYDANSGRTSAIETSDYAEFIAENYPKDAEDGVLSDLFNDFDDYLNQGDMMTLAVQADSFLNLWTQQPDRTMEHNYNSSAITHNVDNILSHLAEVAKATPDIGIGFLRNFIEALISHLQEQTNPMLLKSLVDTIHVYKAYDRDNASTVEQLLTLALVYLERGDLENATILFNCVQDVYDADLISAQINTPDTLDSLKEALTDKNLATVHFIWAELGTYLTFNPTLDRQFNALMTATLDAVNAPTVEKTTQNAIPSKEVSALIVAMLKSGIASNVFGLVHHYAEEKKSMIFPWVYYEGVMRLGLKKRQSHHEKWWNKFEPLDIPTYEFYRDLMTQSDSQSRLQMIGAWQKLTDDQFPKILVDGVYSLWHREGGLRPELAVAILQSDTLSEAGQTHHKEWCQTLFQFVAEEQVSNNPPMEAIYQRIIDKQLPITLTEAQKQRYFLQQILKKDTLSEQDAEGLQTYFQNIDDEHQYHSEIKKMMSQFFVANDMLNTHVNLVHMVYRPDRAVLFWELYWMYFETKLLDERAVVECVDILEAWFEGRYQAHYLTPTFMLRLPSQLRALESDKRYKDIQKTFEERIQKKTWSHVIQPYLPNVKSTGLLGGLFGRK